MHVLRPSFALLTVIGCWRPSFCSTKWKCTIYDIYTAFVLFVMHSFTLSQFMDIIINVGDPDEFSDNVYMLLTTLSSSGKIVMLLINRREIKSLVDTLTEEPFKPKDNDEVKIRKKFDRNVGLNVIQYTILVETTVVCMIISSLFHNFKERKLTYRAWLPFGYSTFSLYTLVYIHQILGLITCSLLNLSCDCLVSGLLEHACGQIEILKYRLKGITQKTRGELPKCVQLHDFIYRYAYTVNEKFRITIGIQFVISTLVVCFNLYQISRITPMISKYLELSLYMACMLTEIFIYCWYGNQLKLKSTEVVYAIFEMNWIELDNNAKKTLLLMMRRAIDPIECNSAYIIPMDLNTFVSVMKMSYSAYNLLQMV